MKTTNTVIMIGFVATDPMDHEFDNGTKNCTFTLKTRDIYGPAGDKKFDVNFHSCIIWNGISTMASTILQKGAAVYISGKLKNRKTEDKTTGKAIWRTEINVQDWTKLSPSDTLEDDE